MNKQKKKGFTSDTLKETAVMTIAVGIIAAAVYFFLIPSQTSISSISALAIIIAHYVPLHVSTVTMILNVVLLLIGFVTCGKEFGAKTVYTSILLPVYLAVFEHVFPDFESLTNSNELDVLCYILVVSIGLSILFNMNASSGGLDIVAKIMNKYLHIELGKWYTNENIDRMLMERHLAKKARNAKKKHHLKGPSKRTDEDDRRFAESFTRLVEKRLKTENEA